MEARREVAAPALISGAYKHLLQEKQQIKPWAGTRGKYAPVVAEVVKSGDEILDFGCAHQTFGRVLKVLRPDVGKVHGYDPATPGLDEFPQGMFHIIVATDVLEHVEPEYLEPTLRLLGERCMREMFFVIGTKATGVTLADGVDHHRIIQPREWWLKTIESLLPDWRAKVALVSKKDFSCWLARR